MVYDGQIRTKKIEKEERESGIELLKIIGMILIIIAHTQGSVVVAGRKWDCLDVSIATTNWQYIILMLFGYFGCLGNNIFFISSAWFLCGSNKTRNNKKILHMLLDVWIISIIYLIFFGVLGGEISMMNVIKLIFPTTFSNNWYITSYLLFYAIFPYLNWIIERISQKELLTINIVALGLYYGISFIRASFFVNNFILFIAMYFFIAYIKTYMKITFTKKKVNYAFLILGGGMSIGIALLTNFIGLEIEYIGTHVGRWVTMSNPFLLMIALALFQIFRQKRFVNVVINRVASLSFFIYIIHENLLVRTIVRPWVFFNIYTYIGYQHIVLWVLGVAAVLLIASVLLGFMYQQTIQKLSAQLTERIFEKALPVYERWINILMKIN